MASSREYRGPCAGFGRSGRVEEEVDEGFLLAAIERVAGRSTVGLEDVRSFERLVDLWACVRRILAALRVATHKSTSFR
jgi:hypothetical protein